MNATSTATCTPRPSRTAKTAGTPDPAAENIAPELAAFVVPIASLTLRRCLALEIDPKYAQIAIERWQTYTGERAVCEGAA